MNRLAVVADSENQVDEEIFAAVSDEALEAAADEKRGQYFTFNFGNPICS